MKFWQKAFLGILTVFIISLNICLYLTSNYSFDLNFKGETERAFGEYHFINDGINDSMYSIQQRAQAESTPAVMDNFMRSYADYYQKEGVFLELKNSNEVLFSNIPSGALSGMASPEASQNAYSEKVVSSSGTHYLCIKGSLSGEYEDYTLTYVRDLSELYNAHHDLTRYLISVSTLVETVLAAVLLLILRKLTHPIRIMQKATRKIADGIYDERIVMPGKDEFHDLADNFNQMAASIQEKIAELDKNARDKQRLIDNLAHELRTPLTAIRGYAEYLQSANTHESNRIKAAGYIVSESDRLKNLALKLLDLALMRNGKLDLQEIIPLELLNQVKTEAGAKLKEKRIELIAHSTLKGIIGDPILLQSLLANLIDNAIKASANGSVIEISAYLDRVPILEVRDSGCGMEEDQTTLVCDPFYRVDKARSRSSGGVGLGLSLCRDIANLHGAELRINSHPGKGTTVRIVFTTSLQLPENSMTVKDV